MKSSFVVALPIVFGLPLTASLAEEVSPAALAASPHRVLFESYDNDNWDLCVMNADGSGRRNLTHTPDVHELYPQASPDGKRICFLVDVQKDGDTLRSVYYMNADGTGRTRVADKADAFVKTPFRAISPPTGASARAAFGGDFGFLRRHQSSPALLEPRQHENRLCPPGVQSLQKQ